MGETDIQSTVKARQERVAHRLGWSFVELLDGSIARGVTRSA